MAQSPSSFSSVRILFATATGTAEDIAQDLAHSCNLCNTPVLSCCAIDDYPFASLPAHGAAGCLFIFIVATAGDGEAPACMTRFWSTLRRASLPRNALAGVHAVVFGLGDRSYAKFNAAARRLATRLSDIGVSLVVPLALGDESSPGGFDSALRPWSELVLARVVPGFCADSIPSPRPPPAPRVLFSLSAPMSRTVADGRAQNVSNGMKKAHVSESIAKWAPGQVPRRRHVTGHGSTVVVEATVAANVVLTNQSELKDEREVRHVELDVSQVADGQETFGAYQPGDIVNVMPRNRKSAVEAFLKLVSLNGDSIINADEAMNESTSGSIDAMNLNIHLPCSLADFVAAQLDLSAMPRRRLLERLAAFCPDDLQREKLIHFSSPEGADDFVQYGYREKRTILMVLRDFPAARPPLSHLVDMIPTLRPRAFSIASSRQAHGLRIHVCAAIVKYTTALRFERVGVCSSMWQGASDGEVVPIYLERGTFRFEDSAPSILVGPGTGVAPMRSFVTSVKPGASGHSRVLYFGCRHKLGDFLYEAEWHSALSEGRLSRLETAFSRDRPGKKIYVQDILEQNGEELWGLLEGTPKGRVFVAGAAGDMPKAIRLAICKTASAVGGLSELDAERYVKHLETSHRFQIECW